MSFYKVAEALVQLDISFTDRGENAQALCPMHERITGSLDHNPSWFIHLETGQHICFSCGYKGNLPQLVCDVKEFYRTNWEGVQEYDYTAANAWLAAATEVTIEDLREAMAKIPAYVGPPPKPAQMSEARLAIYVQPSLEALDSRSVSEEAAEYYGVLWNKNTKTWILPIRYPSTDKLMGWQEKGTVDRTFKNRPAGVQKSTTLFGVGQMNSDLAIVVESPLDCLRIYTAGYEGAVATFGAVVSEPQAKLLRSADKVIAAFDNPNLDNAGRKASEQMREWSRKYGINLFFFNYGDSKKKDPGEMTDAEIAWGIENAKSSILGEKAFVYWDA